jgi:hypothetical protein
MQCSQYHHGIPYTFPFHHHVNGKNGEIAIPSFLENGIERMNDR